jgi:CHASE3 domain sensor protein
MKDNIEKRIVGLFILLLAILAYVAVSAVRNIHQSIRDNDWVNHTHDVVLHANDVLSYLHGGDAALRSFIITGDRRDQAGYRVAYSTMVEQLDQGVALTHENIEEEPLHERFLALQNLISNRIDVARSIVKARDQGGIDAVRALFAANPDIESISRIERTVSSIIADENKLLTERDQRQHLQAQATSTTVYVGLGVNVVLLLLVLWLLRDDLASRRLAARALEEANAQLETKVQERTSELVKSNQSLKQENLERRWSYQALDHQLRYNQLVINAVAELVIVISRALNISRVNPAVVHQTGWEPQDLIAQSIERVVQFPTEGGAAGQSPLSLAMRDGREIQDRPAVLLTRSGRSINVRFSLIPLHDQDKVVGGVVTVRIPESARQSQP